MSNLRSSTNYVWNVSSILGSGATACVYKGVHKKSGNEVAVKSFKNVGGPLPAYLQILQNRECEVMKISLHENIVRLITIEKEVHSSQHVIIMEFCNGGNLYSILEQPENAFGLNEDEFLCLLKDITAGMKFLRDKNITHRDLKPGNILKCITDDGRSVYKVGDFGTAKILNHKEEKFKSLHGTVEYLYPGMYEQLILQSKTKTNVPNQPLFDATVDLWSLGVTLYHLACGSVPFQPFGGRSDREKMLSITTKKESGVISGVQYCKDGEITWSKELPKTCLLSRQLKSSVTSLLAGLLECDEEKKWTFEKFFEYVNDITHRKVFHVFHVNTGKEIRLYLLPNKKLQHLQDQICTETQVPNSKQLLFFNNHLFTSQINESFEVSTFPTTSEKEPLVLLEARDIYMTDYFNYITNFVSPNFEEPTESSQSEKVQKTCNVSHVAKYFIDKLVRCQELLLKMPTIYMSLLAEKVTKICTKFDMLKLKTEKEIHKIEILDKNYSLLSEFVSSISSNQNGHKIEILAILTEQQNSIEKVKQNVTNLTPSVNYLKENILVSNSLKAEWDKVLPTISNLDGCTERANTYVKNLHESWQIFLKFKAMKVLSANDKEFSKLEYKKVKKNIENLTTNLLEQCKHSCLNVSNLLNKWYRQAQHILVQCDSIVSDIISADEEVDVHSSTFLDAEKKVYKINEKLLKHGPKVENVKKQMSSDLSRKKFSSHVTDIKQSQSSLEEVIEENASIVEKFTSLLSMALENDIDETEQ